MVRWGVLSTAAIGVDHVIPALQFAQNCEVVAISSRDPNRAREVANQLSLPSAFGSHEALLADKRVDAVYVPLPNHLHTEWSIKAIEAGKHVLCEKPIGLDAADTAKLRDAAAAAPELKVMEAFMYRFHPQWLYTKRSIELGGIGELRDVQTVFTYINEDPKNIRNIRDYGGGALMDIGCYCVSVARYLFEAEPISVTATSVIHPQFGIDTTTTGVLKFPNGSSMFTCSTQTERSQYVRAVGTTGKIEVEIPFNPPTDCPTHVWHTEQGETRQARFEACSHYVHQVECFADAIIENTSVPTSLTDAVANMRVIDAVRQSANSGVTIEVRPGAA